MRNNDRILVALSGGVDSSVAALLLQQRGCSVEGLFMKNWDGDHDDACSAAADLQSAEAVADRLRIRLHKVSFAHDYRRRVFAHFLTEYGAGRTPNPDILCNREIKFGTCLAHASRLGFDCVATGHYAQLSDERPIPRLLRASDPNKDQSYFLHAVSGAALARCVFPIGGLTKSRVREIAAKAGLETASRPDSTGICFIGERPFRKFLGQFLSAEPGNIVTEAGTVIGRHQGLAFYTLGQRQGLGIGGRPSGCGAAWYVAAKRRASNELVVVQGGHHPALFSNHLSAHSPTWINGPPQLGERLMAKTRYRQPDQACHLEGLSRGALELRFEHPQRAVTPGQSVVLYRERECLGGAVIATTATRSCPLPGLAAGGTC